MQDVGEIAKPVVRIAVATISRNIAANNKRTAVELGCSSDEKGDCPESRDRKLASFESCAPPDISLENYWLLLTRLYPSDNQLSLIVVAFIYIDRLCERTQQVLTELNVHRIVATAMCLALKYLDDHAFDMRSCAKASLVSAKDLCEMELDFLKHIRWDLFVGPSTFARYSPLLGV